MMDEHTQTVGNFLDGRHAENRRRIAELEAEIAAERERRRAVEKDAVRCQGLRAAQRDALDEKNRLISAMGSRNSMLDAELAAARQRREAAESLLRGLLETWPHLIADHFARYKG